MLDSEWNHLYGRWLSVAREVNLEREYVELYQSYRRLCWSKRECVLVSAARLNLPGHP